MRNIRRMSLLALMAVLLFAFNGCGDGSSEIQSNVITENDLFANPQIKTTHEDTMVIFLEHPDGEGHDNDIGEKGVDEVSIYYAESVNHTFCWEDDTSAAGHSMELLDINGNAVLTEHINGECATATITAGYYTMRFTHGGQSEETRAIFIRPVEDISNSKGIVNVSYNINDLYSLLTTNSCEGCDLAAADLSYANLTAANLKEANLNHANLREASMYKAVLSHASLYFANLTRADLSHADLSGGTLNVPNTNLTLANLTDANLSHANLNNASLLGANLSHADLSYANLTKTFLREADMSYANLTGATLMNTDLLKAILNCAIWTDGTTCGVGSTFDGVSCVGGSTDTCL